VQEKRNIVSLGGRLILLWQDMNRVKCRRCGLPYAPSHKKCPHCKNLNDIEVDELIKRMGIDHNSDGIPWSFILILGSFLFAIIFLSRFI